MLSLPLGCPMRLVLPALLALGACAAPPSLAPPVPHATGPLTVAQADVVARSAAVAPADAARAYGRVLAAADSALAPADSAAVRWHLARLTPVAPGARARRRAPDVGAGDGRRRAPVVAERGPAPGNAGQRARGRAPRPRRPRRGPPTRTRSTPPGSTRAGGSRSASARPTGVRRPRSLSLQTSMSLLAEAPPPSEVWGYPSGRTPCTCSSATATGTARRRSASSSPARSRGGLTIGKRGTERAILTTLGLTDLLRPLASRRARVRGGVGRRARLPGLP